MDAVRESLPVCNALQKFAERVLLFLAERGKQTALMLARDFGDLPHDCSSRLR